jgi:hypothetical protein
MAMSSPFFMKVREVLLGPVFGPLARKAWCRRQRSRLRVPGQPVVWVKSDSVKWAEWGAEHGYFALARMSGIPYLSALVAPAG